MDDITSSAVAANEAAIVDVGTNASSPLEAKTKEVNLQDPIKNLKGEFQRKISKLDEKLNQILSQVSSGKKDTSPVVDETPDVDPGVVTYVDGILNRQTQRDNWMEAQELFPELNRASDSFDESFYNAVDAEFSTNLRKDPRGPMKAAKLVAVEMGKMEALTRANLFRDEARRSRIVGEGTISSRDVKKEKDPTKNFNASALSKKLGINPEKLAKRMAANKDKYEGL